MEDTYLLFIIGDCPFCDKAREVLRGEKYTVVDVSNDLMVRGQVKEAFGWRTFPIILQKKHLILLRRSPSFKQHPQNIPFFDIFLGLYFIKFPHS